MPDTFHAGPNLGQLSGVTVIHGDCIEAMAELEADSVDAVVTDPPYGLGFMGKAWDDLPPGLDWAKACYRVLKPGGHVLAFGGTRTWHRLAVAVEDAGFEIRDSIAWLYGSGFPKSRDVGKAIDAEAGVTRTEVIGKGWHASTRAAEGVTMGRFAEEYKPGDAAIGRDQFAPATPEAAQWQGWGTALKPAFEPLVVGRKPLAAGTVAANVLTYGTGALNIDACRIGTEVLPAQTAGQARIGTFERGVMVTPERAGRWPANVVLDEDQAAALDEQSGYQKDGVTVRRNRAEGTEQAVNGIYGSRQRGTEPDQTYGSGGGASRFFYCAKAPKKERPVVIDADGKSHSHATVKPLALMRWLVRLVTPPGGTILDPFAGSGTTIEAAILEGFDVIGIERETDYLAMIQQRIARQVNGPAA